MRIIAIMGLLSAIGLTNAAVLAAAPASVQITVLDENLNPVADARITLDPRTKGAAGIAVTTDAHGIAKAQIPFEHVDGYLQLLGITKAGYEEHRDYLGAFSGGQIEKTFRIASEKTTVIHLRGPKGEMPEGVAMQFWDRARRLRSIQSDVMDRDAEHITDAHGDFVWKHRGVPKGFVILLGDTQVSVEDVPDVHVNLNAEDFAKIYPVRVLEGRLLRPDGAPAKDWLTGGHVQRNTGTQSFPDLQRIDSYLARQLDPVQADGSFTINSPGEFLAIVSPEGVPFLYALNQQSWNPEVHSLTLTVPAVRRTIQTQFVDGEGKPLAGVPVAVGGLRSGQYVWDLRQDLNYPAEVPIAHGIVSDSSGSFALPIYWGTEIANYRVGASEFRNAALAMEWWPMPDVGTAERIVLKKPRSAPAPVPAAEEVDKKHVIVSFLDALGKQVPSVTIDQFETTAGVVQGYGRSPYEDSRGAHYFVDPAAAQVHIAVSPWGWKADATTFALNDAMEQRIVIHVEPTQAASAAVVQPAAGVGSVRVLLPQAWTRRVKLAMSSHLIPDGPSAGNPPDATYWFGDDALTVERARPGRYHMDANEMPPLGDVSDIPIDVTANHETVIDLRNRPVAQWAQAGKPITITVQKDGKPFSGAEVAVYGELYPPEVVARFLDAWLGATTGPEQQDARLRFSAFSGSMAARLATLPENRLQEPQLRQLHEQTANAHDMVDTIALDLTGSDGTLRVPLVEGQPYVVVTRVRDSQAGWQAFTAAPGAAVTVNLRPTRSLTIHSPARPVEIDAPTVLERNALVHLVNNDHLWGVDIGLGPRHPGGDLMLENVPVGAVLHYSQPGKTGLESVTVESGQGSQSVP